MPYLAIIYYSSVFNHAHTGNSNAVHIYALALVLDSNYSNHSSNGGKEVDRSCRLLVKFLCPDYGFTF